MKRIAPKFSVSKSDVGRKFFTKFESGCVVLLESDEDGNFIALDSEDVECSFGENMIEGWID